MCLLKSNKIDPISVYRIAGKFFLAWLVLRGFCCQLMNKYVERGTWRDGMGENISDYTF